MKKLVRILCVVLALICGAFVFASCVSEQGSNDVEYYITYKDTKIELGRDAKTALSVLGTPKLSSSLGDCGGFGEQTRYIYDDIVLYTVTNNDGEKIDQIALSNDMIETPRGICVGDSSEDVITAYGEPDVKKDTKLEYQDGSLVLKFGLEDGVVKTINFIRITSFDN